MKRLFLMIMLMATLLSACAAQKEPENMVVELGETGHTAFFDFEVSGVSACSEYEGRLAEAGCRLILVELELKNTVSYDLPMGRYDFRLFWGNGEDTAAYPLEQFCPEQFPDAYGIPEWEGRKGLLVFQVPEEQKNLALGYLEIFEDDHQGDAWFVYFNI